MPKYIIDREILAILFKNSDPVEVDGMYQDYLNSLNNLIKEATKQYLAEKGIGEGDLTIAINLDALGDDQQPNFKDPRVLELLKSEELAKLIESRMENFIKLIYAAQLPELPEDEKLKLNKYLKTKEKDFELGKVQFLAGLKAAKYVLLSENNTSQPPSINLGGVTSNVNQPATTQTVQPPQPAAPPVAPAAGA